MSRSFMRELVREMRIAENRANLPDARFYAREACKTRQRISLQEQRAVQQVHRAHHTRRL